MARTASAHGLETRRAPDWRATAACRDEDPELFFPLGTEGHWALQIEQAKAVCARCPARQTCLDFALTNSIGAGIFGGLTEDERGNHRRRETRHARRPVRNPRGPKQPPPNSLQELFSRHATASTGEHLTWTGAKTPIFQERQLTPNQVAFMADRGRDPEGPVKRLCEVRGCVQPRHLIDTAERTQCGTRPGYRRHRDRGEEACADCKQANADADNRLRWTGTTQVAV